MPNRPPPRIVGTAPATAFDRDWEQRADAIADDSLTAIRNAAERWTTTLAAVLGLSSIVGLAKGPGDMTGAPTPWKVGVSLALGLALAAAVTATVLGALAAQGSPKRLRIASGEEVRRMHRTAVAAASRDLFRSRVLAVVAVVFVAVATALTWYVPRDSGSAPRLLIVTRDGALHCGPLATDAGAGLAIRDEATKSRVTIPAPAIAAVSVVANCP
jgi:hypothetical protein